MARSETDGEMNFSAGLFVIIITGLVDVLYWPSVGRYTSGTTWVRALYWDEGGRRATYQSVRSGSRPPDARGRTSRTGEEPAHAA